MGKYFFMIAVLVGLGMSGICAEPTVGLYEKLPPKLLERVKLYEEARNERNAAKMVTLVSFGAKKEQLEILQKQMQTIFDERQRKGEKVKEWKLSEVKAESAEEYQLMYKNSTPTNGFEEGECRWIWIKDRSDWFLKGGAL